MILYKYMQATICNQVDVDGSTSGTLNPFNFQDLPQLTFLLEDNGTQITDFFVLDNYSKYLENARAYPGMEPGNWPVMMLNLCPPDLVLASEDDCFGSRCISKYNNPEFVCSWVNTTANAAMYLDIWALTHQILIQHKGDF